MYFRINFNQDRVTDTVFVYSNPFKICSLFFIRDTQVNTVRPDRKANLVNRAFLDCPAHPAHSVTKVPRVTAERRGHRVRQHRQYSAITVAMASTIHRLAFVSVKLVRPDRRVNRDSMVKQGEKVNREPLA